MFAIVGNWEVVQRHLHFVECFKRSAVSFEEKMFLSQGAVEPLYGTVELWVVSLCGAELNCPMVWVQLIGVAVGATARLEGVQLLRVGGCP